MRAIENSSVAALCELAATGSAAPTGSGRVDAPVSHTSISPAAAVAATLDLEIGEKRVWGRVRIGISSELE
jgi:hypothetical protein